MKGLLAWVAEKVESVKTVVYQTYDYVTSTVNNVTSLPYVRNFAYSFSIKFWVGATRPLNPDNVTKLFHSEKTRRALKESAKANLLHYLSYAMMLELLRQQLVAAVETNDEKSWNMAANSINLLYGVTLGSIMFHRIIDNVFINMALAKCVVEENKLAEHFKHCGDDDGALISAGLFSAGNTAFRNFTIGVLPCLGINLPGVGWVAPFAWVAWPARMLSDGEGLREYPYSFVGVCTKHRAEALVEDNAHSLGIGVMSNVISKPVSFLMSYSMSLLVYKLTGLESCFMGLSSYFIDDAIKSFLNTYLIVSVLLQDKPIPGDKNGIDFFYYHRSILQTGTKTVGEWMTVLQQRNATTKWNWRERFKSANEFQLTQFARRCFQFDVFYGDWSASKAIIANPSTTLFLDEYLPLVEEQLKSIIDMREKYGKIVPILPAWLIIFMKSEGYNKLIQIVFDQRLDQVLKRAQSIIREIDKILKEGKVKFWGENYKSTMANLWLDYPVAVVKVIEEVKEGEIEKSAENLLEILPLQDDEFFDVKEKRDVHVDEVQEEQILVKVESNERLPMIRANSAEVSALGIFSDSVKKADSGDLPVKKARSRRRDFTANITDDYDASTHLKISGNKL